MDELHVFRDGQMLGRFELHATELVIGRGGHVVLDAPSVSRLHALLNFQDGRGYVLTDLGSRNGTWVNGASITEAELKSGDHVTIGDYLLRCTFAGPNPALRAPPIAAREGLDDTQELRPGSALLRPPPDHPAMSESARLRTVRLPAKRPVEEPPAEKADEPPAEKVDEPEAAKPEKPEAAKPEKPEAAKPAKPAKAPAPAAKAPKRESVGEDVRRAYESYFVRLRRLVRPEVDPAKETKPTQVELTYAGRRSPMQRRLRGAWIAASVLSLAWIGASLGHGDRTIFTSAAVSQGHQLFGNDCASCHVQAFSLHVPDAACLTCHQGLLDEPARHALAAVTSARSTDMASFMAASWPTHHDTQRRTLDCAECHTEHGGNPILTAAVTDRHCTTCHTDLGREVASSSSATFVGPAGWQVPTFDQHPEFAPLLPAATLAQLPAGSSGRLVAADGGDRARLFLNHAKHMDERLSPMESPARRRWLEATGRERMVCADCHQPDATRDHFAPIRYEQHCASCHPLGVRALATAEQDAAFTADHPAAQPRDVPHGLAPSELVRWVAGADLEGQARRFYADYARAHPQEREGQAAPGPRRPGPPRPGRTPAPASGPVSEEEWVDKRMARWSERGAGAALEDLLFSEAGDGCVKCHRLASPALGVDAAAVEAAPTAAAARAQVLERLPADHGKALLDDPEAAPRVLSPDVPARWLQRARFSHARHETLSCVQCHQGALASAETRDVLLPGVASCVACHFDGGAPARCTTCHDYHDAARGSMDGPLTREALLGGRHP